MSSGNILNLYWNEDPDIKKADLWVWWEGKAGSGFLLKKCDYGGSCTLIIPDYIKRVGFIVRTDCSNPGSYFWGNAEKDYPNDRYVIISKPITDIYLKSGLETQYTSDDGGKTLKEIKLFILAEISSPNQIKYHITPPAVLSSISDVNVSDGEKNLRIESISSLNIYDGYGIIFTSEKINIKNKYIVSIKDYGTEIALPLEVFDSLDFNLAYNYTGQDLGCSYSDGVSCFKLWAPTAVSVVLNLYDSGEEGSVLKRIKMHEEGKGVWSLKTDYGHGVYYTYTVETALGKHETADPYAKSCGINGKRSMIVDLSKTNPLDFENDSYVKCDDYRDAVVWEIHVRDFSIDLKESKFKGKYLAFTEKGLENAQGVSCGIDWLKELGITHVQLQPVFDFATVDEHESIQYNWGYDPENYNIPEGSYSTDPYNGAVRIYEFKRMVQSLHQAGIGVIMDVVYNHTYTTDSFFNRTVPYYYYRFTSLGIPSNGSGCGNETASERYMVKKFILDSLSYWMTEYHIDGFRFDLMAVHDIITMQEVEKVVHSINPSALIYGEGWAGGSVALSYKNQATQFNIGRIKASGIGSVAVFNDVSRDGLKGSAFNLDIKGYINGNADVYNTNRVIFGIQGGTSTPNVSWSVKNSMIVNYMSAHDNYTLWDQLLLSNKDETLGNIIKMNRFGAAIVFLSSGIPFFLAGEEMLRTKNGDENSYKSSDLINSIKWESLKKGSSYLEMALYYKQLIEVRKKNWFIRRSDIMCKIKHDNVIEVFYKINSVVVGMAYINPNEKDFGFYYEKEHMEIVFSSEKYNILEKTILIKPKSVIILKKIG